MVASVAGMCLYMCVRMCMHVYVWKKKYPLSYHIYRAPAAALAEALTARWNRERPLRVFGSPPTLRL